MLFLWNRKPILLHVSFISPISDFKMVLLIKHFYFLPTKNAPSLIERVR